MAIHREPTEPSSLTRLRRRGLAKVVAQLFEGAARLSGVTPLARPERHGVRRVEDVVYAPSRAAQARADLYVPERAPGPHPVVLYIHGGGFRALSKDTHWVMGLGFARKGYLVVNIDYRLAPAHPYPAAAEDACDAYLWVLAEVARYGGDPTRVAVAGESAGANLAAVVGLAACLERPEPWARRVYERGVVPRAVLPACGILEVSDPGRFSRRRRIHPVADDVIHHVSSSYLGRRPSLEESAFASPLRVLEEAPRLGRPLPPFFLPVGTADPLLDDTRRMAKAVQRLGGVAEDRYYPGEIHAFHAFVWREAARACWRDMLGFLDRHVRS